MKSIKNNKKDIQGVFFSDKTQKNRNCTQDQNFRGVHSVFYYFIPLSDLLIKINTDIKFSCNSKIINECLR